MHYTCQVEIAVPRERVVELLTDPDLMPEWTPGLVSVTTVRGERGLPGSVNELRFENVPGDQVMVERFESVDEHHHHAIYQLGPVTNHQRSSFVDLPGGGTRWVAEHEFILPPTMEQGLGDNGVDAFRCNTQGAMKVFQRWCEAQAQED